MSDPFRRSETWEQRRNRLVSRLSSNLFLPLPNKEIMGSKGRGQGDVGCTGDKLGNR